MNLLGNLIKDWCFSKGSNEDSQISVWWKVSLSTVFFLGNTSVFALCIAQKGAEWLLLQSIFFN